ncbi:MAG: gliding motility lipoprotein GldH [Flavobacteriaceae bacterium]
MKTRLQFSGFLALFFLTVSCSDKKQVFQSYKSVGKSWHKDSIVSFEFEAKDTLMSYNLFLNVRANANYPFSNIFLIASIESPDGQIKKDTLEYTMASPDGTMLGNGFSDIKESKLWFKENYNFSETGKYTFKIEQALRNRNEVEGVEKLEGISDVGFSIEYAISDKQ